MHARARTFAASAAVSLLVLGAASCTTTTTSSTSTDSGDESKLPDDLLHVPNQANKALTAILQRVGADPARVSEVDIYGEYLIAEVQDPANAEHIDSYTWRDDAVDAPTPVHLSGPQEEVEAALYSSNAVRWQDIPKFVREVEKAAETATPIRIEDAVVSYVYVERSTSSDLDGRVVIRMSISGPRRSGSAEMTSSGEILSLTVS